MAEEEPKPETPPKPQAPVYAQIAGRTFEGETDISFAEAPVKAVAFKFTDGTVGPDIALKSVEATDDDRMIQEYLVRGFVTTPPIKLGGVVDVVFETRSTRRGLETMVQPQGYKPPEGATNQWVVNYDIVRTLASVIKAYAGKPIGETRMEREEFVLNLGDLVTDVLWEEYNRLLGRLRRLIRPERLAPAIKNS